MQLLDRVDNSVLEKPFINKPTPSRLRKNEEFRTRSDIVE
jgi:hypothetical protein